MMRTVQLSAGQQRVLALLRDQLSSLSSRSTKLNRDDVKHGRALVMIGLAAQTRDGRFECTMDGVEIAKANEASDR